MLYIGRRLQFSVTHATGTWSWAKFYYTEFDVHKCPPWELSVEHPQAGLFPPPPGPDGLLANVSSAGRQLHTAARIPCGARMHAAPSCIAFWHAGRACLEQQQQPAPTPGLPPPPASTTRACSTACVLHAPCLPPHAQLSRGERHRDLISISVVHTLNAALCEFHLRHCPPSEQLARECAKASVLYKATQTALHALEQSLSEPQSPTALAHDAHNAQVRGRRLQGRLLPEHARMHADLCGRAHAAAVAAAPD